MDERTEAIVNFMTSVGIEMLDWQIEYLDRHLMYLDSLEDE